MKQQQSEATAGQGNAPYQKPELIECSIEELVQVVSGPVADASCCCLQS